MAEKKRGEWKKMREKVYLITSSQIDRDNGMYASIGFVEFRRNVKGLKFFFDYEEDLFDYFTQNFIFLH